MYVDAFAEFADAQAVTSTAISNVMDLGDDNTTRDIGAGEPVYLIVSTQTTATDTSSDATLTISLESDSAVGLDSSATVHYTTAALAFAAYATAGTTLVAIRLPSGSYERYLGVRFTVASGPLTAGKFDAFLTLDAGIYRSYADRQAILAAA